MAKTYVYGREVKKWRVGGRELKRAIFSGREVFKAGGDGTHRMVARNPPSTSGSADTVYGYFDSTNNNSILEPATVNGYRVGGIQSIHNRNGFHQFHLYFYRDGGSVTNLNDRIFPWGRVVLSIVGVDGRTGQYGKTTFDLLKVNTFPAGMAYAKTYTYYPPDYNVNSPEWYRFVPGNEYWLTFTPM